MTDLTPVLIDVLSAHPGNQLYGSQKPISKPLDSFLEEATRIHYHISSLLQYLRQIRQPYLSTAPPPRRNASSTSKSKLNQREHQQSIYLTDSQRDEIDSSTATFLHDLSSNIQSLTSTESLRQQTETALLHKKYGKPNGLLWRWAAGGQPVEEAPKSPEQTEDEGRAATLKTVRESVLWFLGHELQHATETQREMVEKRIDREREKEKSILYKVSDQRPKGTNGQTVNRKSANPTDHYDNSNDPYSTSNSQITNMRPPQTYNPAHDPDPSASIESQLSPSQLQLFETENNVLLSHYNSQLSKIQSAEKSLLEISSLQQTLVSHLNVQGEMIEQMVSDAQGTDENVRKGNKELQRASERGSTARLVFWGSVGLCGFLVGWDLVF